MFTPVLAGRRNSKRSFHVEAFIMWLSCVVSHYWVSAGSLSQRVLTSTQFTVDLSADGRRNSWARWHENRAEWPGEEFRLLGYLQYAAQYRHVFFHPPSFFLSAWHAAFIQHYFLSSASLKIFKISICGVRMSVSVQPCVPGWLIIKVISVSGNMTNDK